MFNKQWYFDIGATPLCSEAAERMTPFLQEQFGNPESIHQAGQAAKKVLEQARTEIAQLINAESKEIIFTGGATEGDNLAIKGPALKHWQETKGKLTKDEILISPIEHPAIREAAQSLKDFGFKIIDLKVDHEGNLDLLDLREKIKDRTLLVSVMAANNQFGTIQDLGKIGAICREKKVLFHTDASVYFGMYSLDVKAMKIDLATLSSPKIYGPKGVAALYRRESVALYPLLHGGGQEGNLRSGTDNIPGIVGFAAAAKVAIAKQKKNLTHYQKLTAYFIKEIEKIPGVQINGARKNRLANNVHLSVLGIEGESLVLGLDHYGICASSGSACSSKKLQADPALKALHLQPEAVHGSLRFFWHQWTTQTDLDYLLEKLKIVIEKLRKISAYKLTIESKENHDKN